MIVKDEKCYQYWKNKIRQYSYMLSIYNMIMALCGIIVAIRDTVLNVQNYLTQLNL